MQKFTIGKHTFEVPELREGDELHASGPKCARAVATALHDALADIERVMNDPNLSQVGKDAKARPLREGGWDLAQHQARPVQSLLAPGSVLYAQNLSGNSLPSTAFAAAADASGRGLCLAGAL